MLHILYMNINLQFGEAQVEDKKSEDVRNDEENNNRQDEGFRILGH